MCDHEVLAAGLADQARVRAVALDVLADRFPHHLEDLGRAREVDTRQLGVMQHALRDLGGAAADEVDHAWRQAGLDEDLQQEVRDEQGLRRRLEHHGVAHEHGRGRQVGGDRREVEGADREDESLERPVLETVPGRRVVVRLLAEELVREVGVVAPEVNGLAGGVDLRLVHGLRLAEHRGRVDGVAPRPGEHGRRPKQHRRALVEGGGRPRLASLERGADGVVEILGPADRVLPDAELLAVWRSQVALRMAGAPFAVDVHRNLGARIGQLGEARLEGLPVRVARCVLPNGFVDRRGDLEMSVGGHLFSCQ